MRNGLSKDLIKKVLQRPADWSPMTLDELEKQYPDRFPNSDVKIGEKKINMPADVSFKPDGPHFLMNNGKMVTRFAPSPTGFMHLGGLYQMLINYKLAKQSNGVFMLRVEDTDTKREVGGAVKLILDTAKIFGLNPDEGAEFGGKYGSYYQSQRRDIYHSVASELLATGRAYPCFLSAGDMEQIREKQKSAGFPTGVYGEWARDRNLTDKEVISYLDAGQVPTIRLYSTGDPARKIFCKDAARGSIAFPENNEDIVLILSLIHI